MHSTTIFYAAIITLSSLHSFAQSTTTPTTNPEIRRGLFEAHFTRQSPLSPIEAQNKRHHIKIEDFQRYNLADETFQIHVPDDYDPICAYGILVWINAGDRGSPPTDWPAMLDRHRLIFVGADHCGNQRGIGVRFGLAIDAVSNLRAIYNIDDARVYVAGISGGGKMASALPIIYPEIFNGGISIVGVSYFRNIPVPNQMNRAFPPMFTRPPAQAFQLAKSISRFALITGPGDFNRESIHATYDQGFRVDTFNHVQLTDVPSLGHGLPDVSEIEKAIVFLDSPLPAIAALQFDAAEKLSRAGKLADALKLYAQASLHGDDATTKKAKQQMILIQAKLDTQKPATRPATRAVSH